MRALRLRRLAILASIAIAGGLTMAWALAALIPVIPPGYAERIGILAIAWAPLRCLYASWQERLVLLAGFSLLVCLAVALGLVVGSADGALFTVVAILALTNVLWLLSTRFRLRISLVPASGRVGQS